MRDAIDTEALETDGLDLDLVQQMTEMSLKGQDALNEPSVKMTADMFDTDGEYNVYIYVCVFDIVVYSNWFDILIQMVSRFTHDIIWQW